MSSESPIVATQTRRLSSARSGASPPPKPFKCPKKAPEAVGAELQEGGLKGEVFNEEDNGDAETLPLPGLSDPKADIATLNDDTAECFGFAPKTPQAPAPTTPLGMAVPTMSPESTLLLASIQASLREQHTSLSASIVGVKTELLIEVTKVSDKVEKVQVVQDRVEATQTAQGSRMDKMETDMEAFKQEMKEAMRSSASSMGGSTASGATYGRGGGGGPKKKIVVGGFPRDSTRDCVVAALRALMARDDLTSSVTDVYTTGKLVSIGFIEFDASATMWTFLKKHAGKRLAISGFSELWFSTDKSIGERLLSRRIGSLKRQCIEGMVEKGAEQAAAAASMDQCHRVGIVWHKEGPKISRLYEVVKASAEQKFILCAAAAAADCPLRDLPLQRYLETANQLE